MSDSEMKPPKTTKVLKRLNREDGVKTKKCKVCDARFCNKWQLKFHIRSDHFNLLANVSQINDIEVNQVWFETVSNSKLLMQMQKTSATSLIMKPIPPNAEVKIHNTKKLVDVRDTYPTRWGQLDEICRFCLKLYSKAGLKKHIDEKHHKVANQKRNKL